MRVQVDQTTIETIRSMHMLINQQLDRSLGSSRGAC